jgi:Ca-activated chloride channel family protein
VTFLWPAMLAGLALVPVGVYLAWRIERGRRKSVAALVGPPPGTVPASRRAGSSTVGRIAAGLAVAGFIVLVVGLARPQASVALPRIEGTVMLTFDVSGSMAATDVEPTRLDAAKALARTMVERQPAGVVIGVVAFSDAGLSVLDPTGEKAEVLGAIERLVPTRGTSLGQGILAALDAIERATTDTPAEYYSNRSPAPTATPAPRAPGSRSAAAIVVLSDGENTAPPNPRAGAQAAADAGVRIVTLGIGTNEGATLEVEGFRVHTARDEDLLRVLADATAGSYLPADDEEAVSTVFGELAREIVVRREDIEVTALFAALASVLFIVAGLLSLLRAGRLP